MGKKILSIGFFESVHPAENICCLEFEVLKSLPVGTVNELKKLLQGDNQSSNVYFCDKETHSNFSLRYPDSMLVRIEARKPQHLSYSMGIQRAVLKIAQNTPEIYNVAIVAHCPEPDTKPHSYADIKWNELYCAPP